MGTPKEKENDIFCFLGLVELISLAGHRKL